MATYDRIVSEVRQRVAAAGGTTGTSRRTDNGFTVPFSYQGRVVGRVGVYGRTESGADHVETRSRYGHYIGINPEAVIAAVRSLAHQSNARGKKRPADFDDEDAVLAEVAKHLGEDADDLKIEEDRGLAGFGEGTVYRISTGRGGREWLVAEDTDAAYKLAVAAVKQNLEHEPQMFGADLLASHINMDRLRRDLHSDVASGHYDRLESLDAEDFWREAEREGMDVPEVEVDEDGDEEELREPTSSEIDDLAERMADGELRDPMQYLADLFGAAEAATEAIKIAGIDEDAVAEEVVDADGWESTLSGYDGNSYETASGFVYWREN